MFYKASVVFTARNFYAPQTKGKLENKGKFLSKLYEVIQSISIRKKIKHRICRCDKFENCLKKSIFYGEWPEGVEFSFGDMIY